MRARQSVAAAKTLGDSAAAQKDPKAAPDACQTAHIKQDRTSAKTLVMHISSNENSEQLTHQPPAVGSQDVLLGIAVMPVDQTTMKLMQQQAASQAAAAADISTITSSSTQQTLFFVPVDALVCKANTWRPTQQNQQHQLQQRLTLPTSALFGEATSRPVSFCSLTESQMVHSSHAQHCSRLVMNLLTTPSTMCFNSQGELWRHWHWCSSCWCNARTC